MKLGNHCRTRETATKWLTLKQEYSPLNRATITDFVKEVKFDRTDSYLIMMNTTLIAIFFKKEDADRVVNLWNTADELEITDNDIRENIFKKIILQAKEIVTTCGIECKTMKRMERRWLYALKNKDRWFTEEQF